MALVVGTNCGLVLTAPIADPTGAGVQPVDYQCTALKVTAPANTTITEIGWWCANATPESNFEVGIYSHNAGDDVPDTLLAGASQTNAKGTGVGWKVASGLDIDLSSGVTYWIVLQVDNTTPDTNTDNETITGQRVAYDVSESTLQNPWNTLTVIANRAIALYALRKAPLAAHEVTMTTILSLVTTRGDTKPVDLPGILSLSATMGRKAPATLPMELSIFPDIVKTVSNWVWLLIPDYQTWQGVWIETTQYGIGDTVLYNDGAEHHVFKSITSHNTGNIPSTSTANWYRLYPEPWKK